MTLSTATPWRQIDAEQRLIGLMLRSGRDDAPVQYRIDCAELAWASGLNNVAQTLYGLVALQLGSTTFSLAMLRDIAARTGWWDGLKNVVEADRRPGFSVDLAVAELRELMTLKPVLAPLPVNLDLSLSFALGSANNPQADDLQAMSRLATTVGILLRDLPRELAAGGIPSGLRGLFVEVLGLAPIRLEEHLGLEPEALANMLALEQLRRFFVLNFDLLGAEHAPALVNKAAGLDPRALGPWFSNVRLLIRDARDLFAMIDAASEGGATLEQTESWCALLAAHLSERDLIDLVEELGDRGMTRPISSILLRFALLSSSRHLYTGVRRVRDVALDIGAMDIARAAQALLASWLRYDSEEQRLLALVLAAMGDTASARTAFERSLLLDANNIRAAAESDLLNAGALPVVSGGFETPPGRQRVRQARLAAFQGNRNSVMPSV